MSLPGRRIAAFALLAATSAAWAQDPPPAPGNGSGPPAPKAPAEDAPADPAAAAARIQKLWIRIEKDPPPLIAAEPDKAKLERVAAANNVFKADLATMCRAADAYAKALAGSPGDPRTLWQAGYGRARQSEKVPSERRALLDGAAEFLRAALDGAAADADFRADAEFWLGCVLIGQAEEGQSTFAQGIEHLRTATLAYRKAARLDDSGRAALRALRVLVDKKLDSEARDFAAGVGALTADFGVVTEEVRVRARRGAAAVGAAFPEMPATKDADGKPVEWATLKGAPFVVHFFQAGIGSGPASNQRDVETVLRPLWDRLQGRGLRMVGVSMDFAIAKEKVEKIAKDWEEWGRKERVQDGSLDSVRRYVEDQGVAWPWIWDGTGGKNPVAQALGQRSASAAHAIVVDAAGVIRWRGDAPFTGLPEAVDAAFAAGEKK